MDQIVFESVRKIFRHRPALFNWLGRERGGETIALKDVSFSAARAEVLALLGPNGSGKTTTLKLISAILLPDGGTLRVGGFDARRDAGEVRRQVGIAVATERSFFARLSAAENLDFFAALDEVPRGERAQRIKEVLRRISGQRSVLWQGSRPRSCSPPTTSRRRPPSRIDCSCCIAANCSPIAPWTTAKALTRCDPSTSA